MATVTLGNIKFNWKGAWNSATSYVVDDVVSLSGSSYVCIQAGTNQNPSTATAYWEVLAEGGDVASTLTTQGDILYRDGSGLARLGAGTSGQALITNGTGANPSWGTISSGTYSVHRIDAYSYNTPVTHSATADYIDLAGGNTVNFTPTHADDYVFFTHYNMVNWANYAEGCDVYLMMKAGSSSIGSGDTKLNYNGQHATYFNVVQDKYIQIQKSIMLPCTSLTVGTTYYVEQAGANHNGNAIQYNQTANSGSAFISGMNRHHVTMTHYKKN